MGTQEDYNALIRERDRTRSQYRSCESRIESCEYELRRLRPVKENISALKSRFKALRKDEKRLASGKTASWKGDTRQAFLRGLEDAGWEADYYYKNTLDYALDAVNDRITALENQVMNEYGLLGRLGSALNYIGSKIENFFN